VVLKTLPSLWERLMAWKRRASCGVQILGDKTTQDSMEKTFALFSDFSILGSQAATESAEKTIRFFVPWWSGHVKNVTIFKTQFVLMIFGKNHLRAPIHLFITCIHRFTSSSSTPCWHSWEERRTTPEWSCWKGATLFGWNTKTKEPLVPWLKTPLQWWTSN
jgi:hypothetical protein